MTDQQTLADKSPELAAELLDPRTILNAIGEIIYTWDIASDRIAWGGNIWDVLGVTDLAAISTGSAFADYLAPESTTSRYDAVMRALDTDSGSGVCYQVQYGLVSGAGDATAGDRVWIEDTGRWFAGPNARPTRAHGVIRVVARRDAAEIRLTHRSRVDALTGTLNRVGLVERTTRMLAGAERQRSSFAVLLAGIDNLAQLNRRYGYEVADEVIAEVAKRLGAHLRAGDIIARYAGNKFALVLDACDGQQMAHAAGRFVAAVEHTPVSTSCGPLAVSLRVGGASAPCHARSVQAFLQRAEQAFDLCRDRATKRFAAYEPSLVRADEVFRARAAADEIISALNDRRILLAWQPVVVAGTHHVAFEEAQVRMRRLDGSIMAPNVALNGAGRVSLVQLIDQRMLELALRRLSDDPALRISVHPSGATVYDPEFIGRMAAILALHPGAAARLTIEITETDVIADMATAGVFDNFRGLGLSIAIDDFGAGLTSLQTLRNLDVDLLKIDGAFVQNLSRSADDRFFVRTLIQLAHHLGIPTVAKWVDDAGTACLLTEWGVTYLQGQQLGKTRLEDQAAPRAIGLVARAV